MSRPLLGMCTASVVLDGDWVSEVAEIVGLAEATARRKLREARGNTQLRNLFGNWPDHFEELGSLTVASAFDHGLRDLVADATELSATAVTRRLNGASHKTLLRNVFADEWPRQVRDLYDAEIGELNASTALDDGELIERIAKITELSGATVKNRLSGEHGKTLVSNVFAREWSAEGEKNDDDEPRKRTPIQRPERAPTSPVIKPVAPADAKPHARREKAAPEATEAAARNAMFRQYNLVEARRWPTHREPAAHQSKALEKLGEWYRSKPASHRGGILVLPTGGGKTFTAVRFLCQEPLSDGYKVLWLAHTHHLLEQAIDAFGSADRDSKAPLGVSHIHEPRKQLDVRVVSSTPGHFPVGTISVSDDVLIATLQTVAAAYERKHPKLSAFLESAEGKLVVVFDEAHHAPAPGYARLLERLREANPQMYLLGLTATPTYADEKRQGWLKKLFPQDVVSTVSRTELIAARILSKPHFENAHTNITVELADGEYERWMGSYGDLPEDVVESLAKNKERNDVIADTYVHSKEKYGKTLIFADRWYQCDYLREALIARGIRADVVYSHVERDPATVDERNRRTKSSNAEVLHKFRNDELDVLINVKMLTEGTDVPSVKTVFLTRQTTSGILLTQMIGRALRGPRFGGTEDAHIVSFIDNWKQVITFADFESLPVGQADDGGGGHGKRPPLQLISIELVRKLARQMQTGGGSAPAPFLTLLPIGWYRVEFQARAPKSDDLFWVRQLVMVFESEKGRYDAFIDEVRAQPLDEYASPALVLNDVGSTIDRLQSKFFLVTDDHPGSDLRVDLLSIARHIGQNSGEAPTFFRFEERTAHDIDAIAARLIEADYGPRLLDQTLLAEYGRVDRFWRSIYSTYALFAAQYQASQRRLLDAARHAVSPEVYGPAVGTPHTPPMREASEQVKEAVFRRDGRACCCCGATRDLQIDHIVPYYLGGSSDLDQLQTLCGECNRTKAITEMNFRISRSSLTSAPGFRTLVLSEKEDSSDEGSWRTLVQRTVNCFYQCGAVEDVTSSHDDSGIQLDVVLRYGIPSDWITPHLANLAAHLSNERVDRDMPRVTDVRVTTM